MGSPLRRRRCRKGLGCMTDAAISLGPLAMTPRNATEVPEKDIPLRDDIRLLGRILGDTIREQQGEAVFAVVERIRQTSVRFHRKPRL